MYVFGGFMLICSVGFVITIDVANQNGEHRSVMPVFLLMLCFSIIIGGMAAISGFTDGHNDGYKKGQIDYQKGKIEYRMDIKQKTDTIITILK